MCLATVIYVISFFFSSRSRHTSFSRDWSSDVCSSDLTSPSCPDVTQGRVVQAAQLGQEPVHVGVVDVEPGERSRSATAAETPQRDLGAEDPVGERLPGLGWPPPHGYGPPRRRRPRASAGGTQMTPCRVASATACARLRQFIFTRTSWTMFFTVRSE